MLNHQKFSRLRYARFIRNINIRNYLFRDLVINQLERLADQSLRDNLPSQRINSSQPRPQVARGESQTKRDSEKLEKVGEN